MPIYFVRPATHIVVADRLPCVASTGPPVNKAVQPRLTQVKGTCKSAGGQHDAAATPGLNGCSGSTPQSLIDAHDGCVE